MTLTLVTPEQVKKEMLEIRENGLAQLTDVEKDFIIKNFKVDDDNKNIIHMFRWQAFEGDQNANEKILKKLVDVKLASYNKNIGWTIYFTPDFFEANTPIGLIKQDPKITSLLAKLDAKGIKYELNQKYYKEVDAYAEDIFELGINTYDFIWSWFKIYKSKDGLSCSFSHKYSQNTGKTTKSFRIGFKVVKELHRQLEIENTNPYELLEDTL